MTRLVTSLGVCAAILSAYTPSTTADTVIHNEKRAIAVCLVSEAGWSSPDDYSAILHTLAYRKTLPHWRNRPMIDLVRAYCQVIRYPNRPGGWIVSWPLGEPKETPTGFPAGLNYRNYVRNWLRVQATVDRFIAGSLPHSCNRQPHQWGAPSLPRPRWERLRCGRTQNVFYSER